MKPTQKPNTCKVHAPDEAAVLDALRTSGASVIVIPAPAAQVAESAWVNQNSGVLPRKAFLRAARDGAFDARRVPGTKLVVARRADVDAYLASCPSARTTQPQAANDDARGSGNADADVERELGLRVVARGQSR